MIMMSYSWHQDRSFPHQPNGHYFKYGEPFWNHLAGWEDGGADVAMKAGPPDAGLSGVPKTRVPRECRAVAFFTANPPPPKVKSLDGSE